MFKCWWPVGINTTFSVTLPTFEFLFNSRQKYNLNLYCSPTVLFVHNRVNQNFLLLRYREIGTLEPAWINFGIWNSGSAESSLS